MGNTLTQEEQTLSDNLQQQYYFQSNQYLFHKISKRSCTLHRIETLSKQQSLAVDRNIALYKQIKCNSISKINQYFILDNSGYCSDQQKYYIIFDGHHSPNIKQEYFSRRYIGQGFTSQQIQAILSCILCGLRHYNQAFSRKQSRLNLQSVCINRSNNNALWLKDPWLAEKQNNSQIPINFLANYPSPQKIQATNQIDIDYDEYRSTLFSVGIFGLQFFKMNFRDDLYIHKRFVDRQRVNESLNSIQNARLRDGLAIMLSQDPYQRSKIYQFWGVKCSKTYTINSGNIVNPSYLDLSMVQTNTSPSLSSPKQQFYPNFQNHQQTQPPQSTPFLNLNHSQISKSQSNIHFIVPSSNQTSSTNVNANITWKLPVSTVTSTSYIPKNNVKFIPNTPSTNLTKQFNKPLQIKSNINLTIKKQQTDINNLNNFSKKNNIHIQQQIPRNPPIYNLHDKPLSNLNFQTYQKKTNLHFGNQNITNNYQNSNFNKSFETPRFNYPNPSVNYMQNSSQVNPNPINYFHVYGNNQPKTQQNLQQSIRGSISSSGNSPILTKSIISSVQIPPLSQYNNNNMIHPKISVEENTQIMSNPSLRQTKFVSQSIQINSISGSLPIQNVQKVSQGIQHHSKNDSTPKITHEILNPISQLPTKPLQQFTIPIPKLLSTPESPNPEAVPTSPSTIQITPPPALRNPNKYNSTIVQVNEQTPNQSEQSGNQNNDQIQFIVQQYQTGSRYEGFKKNGLRHGRGKFFYQDGGYYDGQWKKNQMHGWGKLYYEGGQLAYEGNWAHDQFHGYGKVYNDNPQKLDSGFDYTNFDLLDDYWQFYQGMLANDTKQGRGRIQLTNKQVFQGDFHSDRIQGFGKFLRRDCTIVQGIWRDSRLIKILSANDIYK